MGGNPTVQVAHAPQKVYYAQACVNLGGQPHLFQLAVADFGTCSPKKEVGRYPPRRCGRIQSANGCG